MWSYKYTSSSSIFVDQCRVGIRLQASSPVAQLLELFAAVSKEQRCRCFFFDAGVEKHLAPQFKAMIAREDRDRNSIFVGLCFPADFPCHRSTKATSQRIASFVHAMGLEAVDLVVIPWPSESPEHLTLSDRGERQRDGDLFLETWKALQRVMNAGVIHAIGVDRFLPWQLDFLNAAGLPGPKPAVNFLGVSMTSQQRARTSYSHARQVEVVASLEDSAPTTPKYDDSGGDADMGAGDDKEEARVDAGDDNRKGVVSAIALETNMAPSQVITAWALHRGLITLHTADSLGLNAATTPMLAPQPTATRRASNVELGNRVREPFALLHPLASRSSFYSPNTILNFSLGPKSLKAIQALDTGKDEDGKVPNGASATKPSSPAARGDGRTPYDMRQVFMDVGVVAHSSGSAYVEFNHTKVICAVYGPHAQTGRDTAFSEEGQLQCEFSYAPFATPGGRRESRGGKKDDERELSTLLRQTLESSVQVHRLTKSVVDVHVMVLQADGGELAVATICASMALADAGIELYDLVTACSVGYCGTQMVLDPTKEEERSGAGVMTVALMPGSQQVTQWWQEGRFDGQKVAEALELCTDGCGCVHKMMEAKLTASSAKR